jgi:hypothetical protein
MHLTLDREIEDLVANEVRDGHFNSPEALMSVAVRHFLFARKHGEAEANKLAALREELRSADAQINAGQCIDIETKDLPAFFESIERTALKKNPPKP